MLKMRLGAEPLVEVKMPQPLAKAEQPAWASVRRSSQYGSMALFRLVAGKQAFWNAVSPLVNCRLPLELRLAVVNDWPYSANGKGSATLVIPSSIWFPVSDVPG